MNGTAGVKQLANQIDRDIPNARSEPLDETGRTGIRQIVQEILRLLLR
jgi:hypothetical protein